MRLAFLRNTIPLERGLLFRPRPFRYQLDAELEDHFPRKGEENLVRGPSREEARRAARRDCGGSKKARRSARACAA